MRTLAGFEFAHLAAMTDQQGLYEHAAGSTPRVEHGYCTDDNARLLVVTTRTPATPDTARLGQVAFAFLRAAQATDGMTRNRRDAAGRWTDEPSTEDCWGRSTWALGVAAARHPAAVVRREAMAGFDRAVRQRSEWSRAMAFAALGAAEVVAHDPGHEGAASLLRDAVVVIGRPKGARWVWPEARLRYANATLAEATIAAGAALGERVVLERGLSMLGWLLDRETVGDHLSVTGTGGRGPHDVGPQFDQQPIEVAALADACWRAFVVSGDARWARGVAMAAAWFDGANDVGAMMWDPTTGGAFDGLERDGVNRNQGAESTLALISTRQRAAELDARLSR